MPRIIYCSHNRFTTHGFTPFDPLFACQYNRDTLRRPTPFPVPLYLTICALILLAAGCKRPLGPGFLFILRQAEIRSPGNVPPRLEIGVTDRVSSIGSVPLRSLDVRMPDENSQGATGLKISMNGQEISLVHDPSSDDRRMMRLNFVGGWERPERREFISSWILASQQTARGTIGQSAQAFFVADDTALPLWQPPSGIFSTGKSIPQKETLDVTVPSDYKVMAGGKQISRKVSANMARYRFRINPDTDYIPYVVAGRYQEQSVRTPQGEVVFWTFQALNTAAIRSAATRFASTFQALQAFLEPAQKQSRKLYIVESPVELQEEFAASEGPGETSFPQGVLLSPGSIERGLTSEASLQMVEYELARSWFGWRVRPLREDQILMGRGAALFGTVVAAEARGADQRSRIIRGLLDRYHDAEQVSPDRRLLESRTGYSHAERVTTGYKAALFFVALEDVCGPRILSKALQSSIEARGGDEAGYEDLRAAAEFESGRDLAEMFRSWLNRRGLPEEFRARYAAPSEPLAQQ